MTTMRKKFRLQNRLLLGLSILLSCFVSDMDELAGFWQSNYPHPPLIQSTGSQSDVEDIRAKSLSSNYIRSNGLDITIYLSVAFISLHETECSSSVAYPELYRNRAPPSC